jgi:hypothetical protein
MKKFLVVISVLSVLKISAQKVTTVINLVGEFAGISYTDHHVKEEFRPSVPKINGVWSFDFIYHARKINHKISFGQSVFEKYFHLKNKFVNPPNDTLLGIRGMNFGTGIDLLTLSYCLQKEGQKGKKFLFNSKIIFNYSLGLGYLFNRSKYYWRNYNATSKDGAADPYTYMGYEAIHYHDGDGIYLKAGIGFNLVNKKKRRLICFHLCYDQGLRQMAHYDIHYKYGFWNDPQKQVEVPSQILRSRGTTFSFTIGIPITIKK